MHDKDKKGNKNYTLGPLPWKEEDLKRAYFHDFLETQKAIQEHLGFLAYQALESLRLSLSIFSDSVSDLMHSLGLFLEESQLSEFWMRAKSEEFNKLELAIRRGVFSAATSAMALVDNSRNISEEFIIPDYQLQVNETFANNKEHRFIQDLRNYISHFQMIEVDWQVSWSQEGKHTQFLLQPKKLLIWDNWSSLAKIFINEHPQGIDVKTLFEGYKIRVEQFQHWFQAEIEKIAMSELSEYRRYERMLKRFATNSFWNIVLQQAISKKIDPYKYLDRYLTKLELEEVLSLPMNSQIQVDRIIEILDEYGACDEELRKVIYTAFNIRHPSK